VFVHCLFFLPNGVRLWQLLETRWFGLAGDEKALAGDVTEVDIKWDVARSADHVEMGRQTAPTLRIGFDTSGR
jgi:hypothetical protein